MHAPNRKVFRVRVVRDMRTELCVLSEARGLCDSCNPRFGPGADPASAVVPSTGVAAVSFDPCGHGLAWAVRVAVILKAEKAALCMGARATVRGRPLIIPWSVVINNRAFPPCHPYRLITSGVVVRVE